MESLFPTTNPVLIVAIAMVFFLVAPPLSERIRLPGIIGLILAGALIGPNALGVLERDQTIVLLGTVGLLYLMFIAGLELDLLGFRQHRNQSLIFGLLSFALPFGLAAATMGLLGFEPAAVLLIGAVVASHTLLAYPIASRLGIAKNPAVTAVVGGTLLTDTLSLGVLAVIDAAATGAQGLAFWLQFAASLAVYLFLVLWLLPRLGRWFFRNAEGESMPRFFFLMSVLFVSAWLAEVAGAQPIIGAFLAGLVMNRFVPEQSPLMGRVRFFGNAFFIPFFLLSVGMLFDFRSLIAGPRVLLIAAALVVVVAVGKGAAALLGARIFGYGGPQARLMVGLSVPQAAATLAVTFVGLEIGLFDADVVSAVVVLILVSCVAGAALVERSGRAIALAAEAEPYAPDAAPHRILVPLANPATAEALMDVAFLTREAGSTEPVFPLTVVADEDEIPGRVARAERMLAHAVLHAVEADVPANPLTRVAHNPAAGIARAVNDRRITDIIIGWAGRPTPIPRVVFGNIIDQTLHLREQQLMVCKLDHPVNAHERLVVILPPLIDHNPGFYSAVRTIKTMVSRLGLPCEVRMVREGTTSEGARELTRERLADHFREVPPHVPVAFAEPRSWRDLLQALRDADDDGSLIVAISARRGTVAHTAYLDRLPMELTRAENDFAIVYPPERAGTGQPRHRLEGVPAMLSEEHVVFDLGGLELDEAVEALLTRAPLRPKERAEILTLLLEDPAALTPEVLAGILVLQARVPHAERPMMFLGTTPDGITTPALDEPAGALVILLSPHDTPVQEHLASLSEVSEQLASAGSIDELTACEDMASLRNWFRSEGRS